MKILYKMHKNHGNLLKSYQKLIKTKFKKK